jgi:hypothetical protein
MRFYTTQHPFYCGIDLHARTMYVCILDQAGDTRLHRNMPATPRGTAYSHCALPRADRPRGRMHVYLVLAC